MDTEKVKYTLDESYIYLTIPDPYSRKGVTIRKIEHDNSVADADIHVLITAWISTVTGYPLTTTLMHIQSLKSIIRFLINENISLPIGNDWQNFICDFFEFFLTSEHSSKSTLKTRMGDWSTCNSLLNTMKSKRIIPGAIIIPQATLKGAPFNSGPDSKNYVVGEKITGPAEYVMADNGFFCIDLTYALGSDDYFEKLSKEIDSRLNTIQLGANEYWEKVKSYHELGKKLIETVDEADFYVRFAANDFLYTEQDGSTNHLIYSKHGASWLLKFLKNSLGGENLQDTKISVKYIASSTFVKQLGLKLSSIHTIVAKCINVVRPKDELEGLSISEFISKLLGLLHHRDCACLATILIHEHPELTPAAIINVNVSSSRGKSFLYAGNSRGNLIFSSSKPRASKRINAVLTEKAKQIIEDIIKLTEEIRLGLKDRGLSHRRLFLTASKFGFGPASNVTSIMNSSPHCITLYEVLTRYTLLPFDKSTFTLSRIRNSRGILTWLERGSATDMALRLSNTPAVILKHYLPSWLVTKWNERVIRRYQQTLILLASYKSPWLLDATEFQTNDQMLSFINSVVSESTTGDPLGDLINRRLGPIAGYKQIDSKKDLLMKLSADCLLKIFSYNDCNPSNREVSKHESAIHSLSRLISETLTTTISTPAESAIISKLQGDCFSNLKEMYYEAMAKMQSLHNAIEG